MKSKIIILTTDWLADASPNPPIFQFSNGALAWQSGQTDTDSTNLTINRILKLLSSTKQRHRFPPCTPSPSIRRSCLFPAPNPTACRPRYHPMAAACIQRFLFHFHLFRSHLQYLHPQKHSFSEKLMFWERKNTKFTWKTTIRKK